MNLDPDLARDAGFPSAPAEPFVYPESDGLPMADNTRQWELIVVIVGGLDAQYADREDVFVAGDLFWYPRARDAQTRVAPDALVVFGRPKGHRGSYVQAHEDGIAPQVVFEVLSPNNTAREMDYKLDFYDEHGVEEYYLLDPQTGGMRGWRRGESGRLEPVASMQGWTSPRLGIRFRSKPDDSDDNIQLFHPDGAPFETFVQVSARAAELVETLRDAQAALHAEQDARRRAEDAHRRAEDALRAETEARRRADADRSAAEERAARLRERLRRAGLDPNEDESPAAPDGL